MSALILALRSLRAPQWLHFLPVPWACTLVPTRGLADALLGSVIAAGCLAYAYGINAITDRTGDRSSKKNPLAGRAVVPVAVPLVVALAGALALGLAWLSGPVATIAATLSLATGTLYSFGPRFKALPLLSLIGNAGIFVPLVAVGLGPAPLDSAIVALGALLGLLLTQNQLIHELGDAEEDRAAGDHTTALVLGSRSTMRVARVFGWISAMAVLALFGPVWIGFTGAALLGLVDLGVLAGCTEQNAEARRRIHRYASMAVGASAFLLLRVVLTPDLIFSAP